MSDFFTKKKPLPPAVHGPVSMGPMRTSGGPLLVPKKPEAIKGIDVSHYQPRVNWVRVKDAGFEFCFAKCTDGLSQAAHYGEHRFNATESGLLFGSYHFFRFALDPLEQARNFAKTMGRVYTGELPPVLDIEWDNSPSSKHRYGTGLTMDDNAASRASVCLQEIESLLGVTPIIYTSHPFFRNFKNPERFFRHLLWCPAYAKGLSGPSVPVPWSNWAFWQYTDKHELAKEVTGDPHLDANWFNGTRAQLELLRHRR